MDFNFIDSTVKVTEGSMFQAKDSSKIASWWRFSLCAGYLLHRAVLLIFQWFSNINVCVCMCVWKNYLEDMLKHWLLNLTPKNCLYSIWYGLENLHLCQISIFFWSDIKLRTTAILALLHFYKLIFMEKKFYSVALWLIQSICN